MQYYTFALVLLVIFQSAILQSCKFHPSRFLMVRHFPLLQIPVTRNLVPGREFDNVTTDTLQTFKIMRSKVKVTA